MYLSTLRPLMVCAAFLAPAGATAQQPPETQAAASQAQPPAAQVDPDTRLDPLQPDFNLASLPTTLRVPRGKWGFRVTHRFTRPLGEGDVGSLLENFFGFDSGGLIGLEFRYGLRPGTQIGIHRTSVRTIHLFAQHNVLRERDGHAIGLDSVFALEGENNLRAHRQGVLGLVLSRAAGTGAIFYLEPMLVLNSNPSDVGSDHTALVALGTRLRIRPAVSVVAEISPRVAGHRPGPSQISVGVERRAGGHLFQLNVSNGFGTTFGQLARGGISHDNWYIGFNISRKFFR